MKSLERGMEEVLMLNKDKPAELQNALSEVQNALSEVKKLCEKKGKRGKTATKVRANSNDGGQQK